MENTPYVRLGCEFINFIHNLIVANSIIARMFSGTYRILSQYDGIASVCLCNVQSDCVAYTVFNNRKYP